jgi:hypothetical protein
MTDLWPEDIGQGKVRAPVMILKEQAAALGKKTANVVEATVESTSSGTRWTMYDFVHEFYLVGPLLNNYRYQLFTARNGVDLYPVKVEFSEFGEDRVTASSEEELLNILGRIFSSDKTRKVVDAIIAQSQN